jgi:putative transposase
VIRASVTEVAGERPSFGYRRVTAMVRRRLERAVNTKRVRRIMRLDHLTLASGAQPPRKRLPKHPGKILTEYPDEAWQMDAKYVWCGRDRWMILQNIIDTCTGEWVGYLFDKRYRRQEIVQLVEATTLARWPGPGRAPGTRLRMDNLRAYASDQVVDTARQLGFAPEFIHNHVPEDNGMVESFHASLDRDYLNLVEFQSKEEAAVYLAKAFEDYNTVKPKERLGWKTPREYYKSKTLEGNANANQNPSRSEQA